MRPRTTKTLRLAGAALAACLASTTPGAWAQAAAAPAEPAATAPLGLKALFEAAWARQPEALAMQARLDAAQAQRRAAEAWTPEPPALEASHTTDRLTRNDGSRELEIGVAVPLWLPGERRQAAALADAEGTAAETRMQAARLRLAAEVREAWWAWQRTCVDADIAQAQLDSARRLADDVARRTRAGELARADQHQADGAVAANEAAMAQAQAQASAALQRLKALTGGPAPDEAPGLSAGEPEPATAPGADGLSADSHPALAELQDRRTLAERAAALASTRSRANPELSLATTRDRGAAGERYGQKVTLALRIPFGGGARHEARVAATRADALEAKARLALERERLQAGRDAALAQVQAARVQQAAAERRATLASESRGFFEKSFRLGETDLPTRLRIEAEASEAERQAARSRIELAAAISAWRQALGLLPQ